MTRIQQAMDRAVSNLKMFADAHSGNMIALNAAISKGDSTFYPERLRESIVQNQNKIDEFIADIVVLTELYDGKKTEQELNLTPNKRAFYFSIMPVWGISGT